MSTVQKAKKITASWETCRRRLKEAYRRKLAVVKTDEEKRRAGVYYKVALSDMAKEEKRELARL